MFRLSSGCWAQWSLLAYLVAVTSGFAVQPVQLSEGPRFYVVTNASSETSQLLMADLNGDARPDAVLGGHATTTILLNSNGVFSVKTNLDVGGKMFSGDFNDDGKLDLISGEYFLFGIGDGTFDAQASGLQIHGAGDFNRDGLPDIIQGERVVSFNQGNNTYAPITTLPYGDVRTGEFAGDGSSDIVILQDTPFSATFPRLILYRWDGEKFVDTTNSINALHLSICDFNGDGKQDVIETRTNTLELFTVTTNGLLVFVTSVARYDGEKTITAGDFNGDGFTDLISFDESYSAGKFAIRYGTAVNAWGNPVVHRRSMGSRGILSVVTTDLDGDGISDPVILVSAQIGTGFVALEAPLSSSNELSRTLPEQLPYPLARHDFNSDGRTDLLVSDSGLNITTWLSNGDSFDADNPTFAAKFTPSAPIADINGDGHADTVISVGEGLLGTGFRSLIGNGDGTFTAGSVLSVPFASYGRGILARDFNGDGKVDLLTLSQSTNSAVHLALGNGDGTFGPKITLITTNANLPFEASDLNNDGNVDFASGTATGGIRIHFGKGDGTFDLTQNKLLGTNIVYDIKLGDFNQDGRQDIVALGNFATVLSQTDRGTFTPLKVYQPSTAYRRLEGLQQGDFNGDGYRDIFFFDYGNRPEWKSIFLLGSGPSTFQKQVLERFVHTPDNYTGDGKPDFLSLVGLHPNITPFRKRFDLLWQDGKGGLHSWMLRATNFAEVLPVRPGTRVSSGWQAVGMGDFNGDSNPDIVWQNNDGQLVAWLLDGIKFLEARPLLTGPKPSSGWRMAAITDLNSDEQTDFLWQNNAGQIAVWLMNGTNRTSVLLRDGISAGSNWRLVTAAHFNSDSKPDLLWQNKEGVLAVWYMNGTEFLSSALVRHGTSAGSAWKAVAAQDFDENETTDILLKHDDGRVAIWLMNGTTFVQGLHVRKGIPPPAGWRFIGTK